MRKCKEEKKNHNSLELACPGPYRANYLNSLTNDCSDNIYNSYGVFILWYIAIGNYINCFTFTAHIQPA